MLAIFFFFFMIPVSISGLYAFPCNGKNTLPQISPAFKIDKTIISESSGLAISKDRRYAFQINDSGGKNAFYITQINDSQTKSIYLKGPFPFDYEDLAYGNCPEKEKKSTCLYMADTGDNFFIRQNYFITVVKITPEMLSFSTGYTKVINGIIPIHRINFHYPGNRPINSEAIALSPITGDIFIFSKDRQQSEVFRLRWGEKLALPYGNVPMTSISGKKHPSHNLVTAADISDDGSKFLLLTYRHAYFFPIAIDRGPLTAKVKAFLIPLKRLPQQEAISFYGGADSFIYTTEATKYGPTESKQVSCPRN